MNIRELIPAVVEEVILGLEQCEAKGFAVFAPKEIEIEFQGVAGTAVKVVVPLYPNLRHGGQAK